MRMSQRTAAQYHRHMERERRRWRKNGRSMNALVELFVLAAVGFGWFCVWIFKRVVQLYVWIFKLLWKAGVWLFEQLLQVGVWAAKKYRAWQEQRAADGE